MTDVYSPEANDDATGADPVPPSSWGYDPATDAGFQSLNGDPYAQAMYHLALGGDPDDLDPGVQHMVGPIREAMQPPEPVPFGVLGDFRPYLASASAAPSQDADGDDDQDDDDDRDEYDDGDGDVEPANAGVVRMPVAQSADGDAQSPSTFDRAKASAWMNSNALPRSKSQCAAYVRQGLEAGGFDTSGHPIKAGQYGPLLEQGGATVLQRNEAPAGVKTVTESKGYKPQEGDVVVFDITKAHPDGHIQYYDGAHWISDFKQNFYSPFHDGETPASTIYRLPGGGRP